MSSNQRSSSSSSTLLTVVGVTTAVVTFYVYRRRRRGRFGVTSRDSSAINAIEYHKNIDDFVLSTRGKTALVPAIPYLKQFISCLNDPCSVTNPNGYIAMCVAENKLVTDMLAERSMRTAASAFGDSSVYLYNNFNGEKVARDAVAYFLSRRFFCRRNDDGTDDNDTVSSKHVAVSSGAAAVLNALFFTLGDRGDACLIPAPYYAAFDNDMKLVAGIEPIPIHQKNAIQGPTTTELETGYRDAKKLGYRPRFILVTNPNNPLAIIYSPMILLDIVNWARSKSLHVIVDEVYALSTHARNNYGARSNNKNNGFPSIIRVLDNKLGNDVHMVWAASKDLGASGLRYGVLYSQNEYVHAAMNTLNTFSCVPGPIQHLVAEILTDDDFMDNFLSYSQTKLLESYRICTTKLEEMVLPFVPAQAGMFVYVDFSSLLPHRTYEYEDKLCEILYTHARVVLTQGRSQHDIHPGMFRICYAWVTPEVLEIAMERISCLVAKLRRMDWDDLLESSGNGMATFALHQQ